MRRIILFREIIENNDLGSLFSQGQYGIEKEGVRTLDEEEMLSSTDHPESLGDRSVHPYIQTDYSESQPEIVTPPFQSMSKAMYFLKAVNDVLYRNLEENEYIWPFSIPGRLPDDHEIRISQNSTPEVMEYRTYTGDKYGRSRQLISGLHINFSFTDEFFEALVGHAAHVDSLESMKNYVYMKVSRNFLHHQWILIYLYGATPIAGEKFLAQNKMIKGEIPTKPMRSIRNSSYGYYNDTDLNVRYDELEHYVDDITTSVATNKIGAEREYYGDVRLKGNFGESLRQLLLSGIKYIELRSMDLNPFSPTGMTVDQARFLDLFVMYMLWTDDTNMVEAVEEGNRRTLATAEEDPLKPSAFKEEGIALVNGMKEMLSVIGRENDVSLIEDVIDMFEHPEKTTAGRIITMIHDEDDFFALGRSFGHEYRMDAREGDFKIKGFIVKEEDHKNIEENIRKGIKLEKWNDLLNE